MGLTSGSGEMRIRLGGRTTNYEGTKLQNGTVTNLANASGFDSGANDLGANGSAFYCICYDYAETASEKLCTVQFVGNNTGYITFIAGSPFNLQTNISSFTITTVGGTSTMGGTVEIYGVN